MGVAPVRWDSAQRFLSRSGFFAWHEAFEFLRACLWGGSEMAFQCNYSRERLVHGEMSRLLSDLAQRKLQRQYAEKKISSAKYTKDLLRLRDQDKEHRRKFEKIKRREAVRQQQFADEGKLWINDRIFGFVKHAIDVLLDRTLVRFAGSPAAPLARVLALSMVAAIYGGSPTLASKHPLSFQYHREMYKDRVLIRQTLLAEQYRLFQTSNPKEADVLIWFDAAMEHVARDAAEWPSSEGEK
jgi:hypothetical protein